MKGIIKAGEVLCLKTQGMSCAQSKIPKEAKAFYLHPKRGEKLGDVWYSLEPMGVNYLGSMLLRISKEAGTSVVYTNHCIRSTSVQKLAEGGLEAREIMTVSGHRSESSLQNYWAPSLDNRKPWSNLLCAGQENKRPLEVSPSTSSTTSPAKRQRSHMDF
ncbi:uncharacterized protein AKAME5_000256200 [Lates japonicus]|uniref:Tyr recombinase domain-containing protein n=1 Tax=Lates japonicus TaxID=270547 RepID=A0AAD3QYS6_LATJO|nr:uncharacterized protein AKAME5_000256200 [Lates japonicus]